MIVEQVLVVVGEGFEVEVQALVVVGQGGFAVVVVEHFDCSVVFVLHGDALIVLQILHCSHSHFLSLCLILCFKSKSKSVLASLFSGIDPVIIFKRSLIIAAHLAANSSQVEQDSCSTA